MHQETSRYSSNANRCWASGRNRDRNRLFRQGGQTDERYVGGLEVSREFGKYSSRTSRPIFCNSRVRSCSSEDTIVRRSSTVRPRGEIE
jgi:hypothetical protein